VNVGVNLKFVMINFDVEYMGVMGVHGGGGLELDGQIKPM